MAKTVYCYNEQKYFTHTHSCQPSPLEPGVYLMPTNTVETTPPVLAKNQYAKWNGSEWIIEHHTGKYLIKSGANWDTIITGLFPPTVEYLDCPIEVENIGDCDINGTTVIFNQAKKTARLAAEAQAKADAEAQAQAEKEARQAIRQGFQDVIAAIDLIDHTTIADANTKKVCGDLKRALKDLARFSKDATIRTLTV